MARWLLVLMLVACDSGTRTPPIAVKSAPRDAAAIAQDVASPPIDAAEPDLGLEPGAAPTCPPAEHDALVTCLMTRSPCPQRNEILPQRRPDLELVRTTWSGCGETYVIAKYADRWYAIQELFYEQSHGRRDGVLHVQRVRDVRAKDHRVTQIDYSTDEDISNIDDSAPDGIRNAHTHSDDRLACTWPADGAPTCAPAPR